LIVVSVRRRVQPVGANKCEHGGGFAPDGLFIGNTEEQKEDLQ